MNTGTEVQRSWQGPTTSHGQERASPLASGSVLPLSTGGLADSSATSPSLWAFGPDRHEETGLDVSEVPSKPDLLAWQSNLLRLGARVLGWDRLGLGSQL